MNLFYVFFIIGIALMILEIFTPSSFIFFSIGIGSILSSFFALIINDIKIIILINSFLSILTYLVLKKYAKKINKDKIQTNSNNYIGKHVIIKDIISKNENEYLVKIFGEEWKAYSNDEFLIGDKAEITQVNGASFEIKKIN